MKKNYVFTLAFILLCHSAMAQQKQVRVSEKVEGHIFKPGQVEATDERIKKLTSPAGFAISKFAENLGKPRMLAVSPDGQVYVTNREKGTVTLLPDKNKDFKSEEAKVVARKENLHGIAFHNNLVYLVTANEIFSALVNKDGTFGALKELIKDLPEAGQHNNRTIAFGPDNLMYVTVGSTCNACEETSKENATILQLKPDGTGRRVYATGLRNTIGFGWHPQTKEMYGFDHGIDWLGDDSSKEELNKIEDGGNYGWPYVYENGIANKADQPKDMDWETYAKKTKFPVLTYTAHSAPLGMIFYTGKQFPEQYRNDAIVAMHGSWNRKDPSGYKLIRVKFENGQPTGFEDFLSGFLVNNNQDVFGRVCGLTQMPDGSLLVSDDLNGVVYRITYTRRKQP